MTSISRVIGRFLAAAILVGVAFVGTSTASTDETLDGVQRQYIEKVLRECGGRINGVGNAAVRLGLHPNTLRFRIKKLGVVVPGRDEVQRERPRPAVGDPSPR